MLWSHLRNVNKWMSWEPIIYLSVSVYIYFGQSKIGYWLRFLFLDCSATKRVEIFHILRNANSELSSLSFQQFLRSSKKKRYWVRKIIDLEFIVICVAMKLGVGNPGLENNRFFCHFFTISCSCMYRMFQNDHLRKIIRNYFQGDFSSGELRHTEHK